jgi:hypothetical protein
MKGLALIDCFVHLNQDMISLDRCIQQPYVCECMEIVDIMKQALLSSKLFNPDSYKEMLAFTQIFKM